MDAPGCFADLAAATSPAEEELDLAGESSMENSKQLLCTFDRPTHRRFWLLCKALECVPLNRALDLARMAEEFVLGAESESPISPHLAANSSHPQERVEWSACANKPAASGRSKLPLSAQQRGRLLDRLANGARNPELASEFGLSPKQVQGIRISETRKGKLDRTGTPSPEDPPQSIEEVVRFLRQQDDVVVREDDGRFLVNGRFKLVAAELIERANRIRAGQGKSAFRQIGTEQHPNPFKKQTFWKNAPATAPSGHSPNLE
jgi:hypothetical protein